MKERVLRYLMEHFGVVASDALRMVEKYPVEISTAEAWGSRPYYPAGNIADFECLIHLDPCVICLEEAEAEAAKL